MNILITDGESDHTINILQCFRKKKNLKIFILSNKKFPCVRFSRYFHKFQYQTFKSENEQIKFIKSFVEENGIDMLFPIDEEGIKLISQNKLEFKDICKIALIPDYEQSIAVSDKWNFYNILKNIGINLPDTFRINESKNKRFPIIIKPRKGHSGNGIHLIKNPKQLDELNISEFKYIAQEYIEGYDIDCSFIASNGKPIAIIVQKPLKIGNQLNFGPARDIQICQNEKIKEIIKEVIKIMAWNGVGHADLRYCKKTDTFKLIEINPRYWSSILASLAAGVNFPLIAIELDRNSQTNIKEYKTLNYLSVNSEIKRLIKNKRKNEPFDFSTLYHVISDPLPFIVYKLNLIQQRYFH